MTKDKKPGLRLVGSEVELETDVTQSVGTLASILNALGSVGVTDKSPEEQGIRNIMLIVDTVEDMTICSLNTSVSPEQLLALMSRAEFNLNLGILNGAGYEDDE